MRKRLKQLTVTMLLALTGSAQAGGLANLDDRGIYYDWFMDGLLERYKDHELATHRERGLDRPLSAKSTLNKQGALEYLEGRHRSPHVAVPKEYMRILDGKLTDGHGYGPAYSIYGYSRPEESSRYTADSDQQQIRVEAHARLNVAVQAQDNWLPGDARDPFTQIPGDLTPLDTANLLHKPDDKTVADRSADTLGPGLGRAQVFFKHDSDEVLPSVMEMIQALPSDKTYVVKGYADARGDGKYNLDLADRRAQVVARLLDKSGFTVAGHAACGETVASEQLEYYGFDRRVLIHPVSNLDKGWAKDCRVN